MTDRDDNLWSAAVVRKRAMRARRIAHVKALEARCADLESERDRLKANRGPGNLSELADVLQHRLSTVEPQLAEARGLLERYVKYGSSVDLDETADVFLTPPQPQAEVHKP